MVDDADPSHSKPSLILPNLQLLMPLASLTPFLMVPTFTQESPTLPPTLLTIGASDDTVMEDPSSS